MNAKTILKSLLFIFIVLTGCSHENSSEIVGTWRLETYQYGNDTTMQQVNEHSPHLKLITPTNFTWVAYGDNGLVTDMAGGSYTLEGDVYKERIDFGGMVMLSYVGHQHTFKMKIDGDKMFINGSLYTGEVISEVWEKVK